jgi:hypothetical protein
MLRIRGGARVAWIAIATLAGAGDAAARARVVSCRCMTPLRIEFSRHASFFTFPPALLCVCVCVLLTFEL